MSVRKSSMCIIIGFTLLFILNLIFFPITRTNLENRLQMKMSPNQIIIQDSIDINGSILYLVRTSTNKNYLIHAEKALFLTRYRLLHPMILYENQEFSIENLTQDISINFRNNTLEVRENQDIIGNLWPLLFVGLICLTNLIVSILRTR